MVKTVVVGHLRRRFGEVRGALKTRISSKRQNSEHKTRLPFKRVSGHFLSFWVAVPPRDWNGHRTSTTPRLSETRLARTAPERVCTTGAPRRPDCASPGRSMTALSGRVRRPDTTSFLVLNG